MRIVFMGTPGFAVPSLDMLAREGHDISAVVTQPDKPKGRGNRVCCPPVKEYAEKLGMQVLQPEKVKNNDEFISILRELSPDAIVVVAYGKILPREILDIPAKGCINVHASLLPKYRGAAPVNWAIINGESMTGITTMLIDEGMDTGNILLKKEMEIPGDMTAGELGDKLAVLGAEVLKETLEMIEAGTIEKTPQREDEASYAPSIKKETGLIDWGRASRDVHNLVRGTNPWPGAYTFYDGKRVKIWKTRTADEQDYLDYPGDYSENCPGNYPGSYPGNHPGSYPGHLVCRPGTICMTNREGLVVACGEGFIQVTELQFDGSRKLCVEECWHNFNIGEVFG